MTEQRQMIQEALKEALLFAQDVNMQTPPEGRRYTSTHIISILTQALDAEPPQASASAEELAAELYAYNPTGESKAYAANCKKYYSSRIIADRHAQLKKAAERVFALLGINIEGYIIHKCQPISGQTLHKTILGEE